MVGLVDCNSFYASCERVFRPDLRNRPIAVLSNNDGCIVAMSSEAKSLGIRRGTPYFQVKADLAAVNAAVFSSNYTLYQSLSNRVMRILSENCEGVEEYSIDEAFITASLTGKQLKAFAAELRSIICRDTGIPVSIGFGRTKTLAKTANKWAKKAADGDGVCILKEEMEEAVLRKIRAVDIWGIGPRKGRFLLQHGIVSAWDLRQAPSSWVKKHLTVVTLRTVWELQGFPSIDAEVPDEPKKGILSSRGFSRTVSDIESLREAAASYTAQAVDKLMRQQSTAGSITVFIQTRRHAEEKLYRNSITFAVDPPSSYLPDLTKLAVQGIESLYRKGYAYAKVGVFLNDIDIWHGKQRSLFEDDNKTQQRKHRAAETAMDIRERYGKGGLYCLQTGMGREWQMKQDLLSPKYTTSWEDIPLVL
ncbi:MAG: Y-family DNA polymerase [Spirochaetia bacterium]|nr:Y-family DNA polymerase [Spirochaetia bacterium]MCF7953212.1 Y-family DNA polymerase [Spirochaetales bacterium]